MPHCLQQHLQHVLAVQALLLLEVLHHLSDEVHRDGDVAVLVGHQAGASVGRVHCDRVHVDVNLVAILRLDRLLESLFAHRLLAGLELLQGVRVLGDDGRDGFEVLHGNLELPQGEVSATTAIISFNIFRIKSEIIKMG